MKTALCLFIHLTVNLVRLTRPGGTKALMAETLMLKHQVLVLKRGRKRAPNLNVWDRLFFGIGSILVRKKRLRRIGIVVSPATLLKFHRALVKRKYRKIFSSSKAQKKPGPKGPSPELIKAIIEMKKRNPRFGCPRIAEQISAVFGVQINKDVVRRVLAKHFKPVPCGGPSWLTFLGHMKDSLWSVDMFRCESVLLKTHWAMVVMDQYSRRIIGFGVHKGNLDGQAICRMFNKAIVRSSLPQHLSSDNDPLFRYFQWKANLRVLDI